jgi:hypothetical protein
MSKKHELSYKWVIIGGGVILTLHFLMRLLFIGGVTGTLVAMYGPDTGSLIIAGVVAFVSYFIGGALIGAFSPGETVKEPALATFMAIMPNAMHSFLYHFEFGQPIGRLSLGLGITFVVGILMAVAGAWLGEKLQGRTVEKLVEDGEIPAPKPSSDDAAKS